MVAKPKEYRLTQSGVQDIKAELEELKKRRLEVAVRLKEAKEQLDLTENSDWADAQDESKYVEGRLDEIDHILRNVKIIKAPANAKNVQLGSTVHLSHNGQKLEYTLVGSLEADPEKRKISEESPLGRALMGKQVGDEVDVRTGSGDHTYTISKIS